MHHPYADAWTLVVFSTIPYTPAMLTFTDTGDSTLHCTGAGKPFTAFPKQSVAGEINLVSKPEEQFDKEIVCWPGEYDIAGVTVRGIGQDDGQQVSFAVEADGYRIAFP